MDSILSVGIDVGTTSTHLAFTQLELANQSRVNEPTRLVVAARKTIYQSAIHLTPLLGDSTGATAGIIDAERVVAIIRDEYAKAGIDPAEVSTGAVIITGESAKQRNAEAIVTSLAQLAGNFVSASAGPHLESVLAARGAGAVAASRDANLESCDSTESRDGKKICNADIGGGTTNIALCRNGRVEQTDWLAVGGKVCKASAQDCANAADRILARIPQCDEIWFSGGVAEVMAQLLQGVEVDDTAFGDAGVLLARALIEKLHGGSAPKAAFALHSDSAQLRHKFHIPPNPIRATVIGAGAHSLQLSGSTVSARPDCLPLRNLPILRLDGLSVAGELDARLKHELKLHDLDWKVHSLAIMLPDLPRMGYTQVKAWAQKIAQCFRESEGTAPLVILVVHDVAAALGQLLTAEFGVDNRPNNRRVEPTARPGDIDIIVLDGVFTDAGDYIDIGKPVANGQSIPVVIKEFVFAQSESTAAACAQATSAES